MIYRNGVLRLEGLTVPLGAVNAIINAAMPNFGTYTYIDFERGKKQLSGRTAYKPHEVEDMTAAELAASTAAIAQVRAHPAFIEVQRPSDDDITAERERRMSVGFDFTFPDGRGVHRIGSTGQDMKGWSEVTMAANAFVAKNLPGQVFNLVTDTGPVACTALEWQDILIAATTARQHAWAKSFALLAMSPRPTNYRDDSFWS